MDAATLQQARTSAIAAAARLRLPLRTRSWHGQAGEFAGGGTGTSLDFQDHRAYTPGDDPRHINWQAFARTGSYTMKLFREEVRPLVDLVFDASESMFYQPDKARRTAELFHFLGEGCAAAGAAVAIHAVKGDAATRLDPAGLASLSWHDTVRALAGGDPAAAPDLAKVPLRANSIRVLLSDLLFPGDPEPLMRHLARQHGTIIVFSPWIGEEAHPDWAGNHEFIDPERGTRHPHRIEPVTLRRYRDAYVNHFALWKHAARRHHAAFARIPAEEDLATALFREAVPAGALEGA